ncbi:putative transmembrane protein [Apostichopus japonicus]|uniref:Putative transmembrane protein n=1 Tax=Stichopus japonicus TaxID=307972 RepID=A0A2G8KX09_STIJA|nr:putative transmembrane protein [Apostichopus japonicus]
MSCAAKIVKTIMASQALLVRLIYAIHASIGVIIAASLTKNNKLYFFQLFLLVSAAEYIWTIKKSKKGEWKWLLPSVVLYIAWLVPQIFILEYSAMAKGKDILREFNQTTSECRTDLSGLSSLGNSLNISKRSDEEYHDTVLQLNVLLQQSMMLVFILGRWLGPKGSLTREQLSQLLLAYVGMAADMLEFITETLTIPRVACDEIFVTIVMVLWSWSLLQFTLGLTATKQSKTRVVGTAKAQQEGCNVVHGMSSFFLWCCGGEIWALLVSVIMQDGPYLVMRLYLLIKLHEVGQIFFTIKNGILFCLQLYRFAIVVGVVANSKNKEKDTKTEENLEEDPPYEIASVSKQEQAQDLSSSLPGVVEENKPGDAIP